MPLQKSSFFAEAKVEFTADTDFMSIAETITFGKQSCVPSTLQQHPNKRQKVSFDQDVSFQTFTTQPHD